MRHLKVKVVGVKHHVEAARLALGWEQPQTLSAHLLPEPTNAYDTHAVRVMVNGLHVGYIPKEQSGIVSQLLKHDLIRAVDVTGKATSKHVDCPWFFLSISHEPLMPGKKASAHMREGFSIRIECTRTSAELLHVGQQINQCSRLREEDKALLRRVYLDHTKWIKEHHEPVSLC